MANVLNILDRETGKYVSIPSIKGADGQDGYTPVKGVDYFDGKDGKDGKDGENGKDGLSAYEVALKNGFEGTEAEWLESLKSTEVATDVEDIYDVAKENGGCIKGYEYLNPDYKLYNVISAGTEVPTDAPIQVSEISLFNFLLNNEELVYIKEDYEKYESIIDQADQRMIVLASTVEDLSEVSVTNPAYLFVYELKNKFLKVIKYPEGSIDAFRVITTIYDNDIARIESFTLPATKWYPTMGTLTCVVSASNGLDVPQERIDRVYNTVDGALCRLNDYDVEGGHWLSTYKFSLSQTANPMIIVRFYDDKGSLSGSISAPAMNPTTQAEILNQMSTDTEAEPVYYTKEEWALVIEDVPAHTHKLADITNYTTPEMDGYIQRPLQESIHFVGEDYYDQVPTVGYVQTMLDEYDETYIKDVYALKSEIPEISGGLTETEVNALIDAKLGVIENGSY